METVPFTIKDTLAGLIACSGIARATEHALFLQFRTQDGIFGVLKSRPRPIALPFSELESVTYSRGLVRGKLRIQARTLGTVAKVPGSSSGEVVLQISRRHRTAAKVLATAVNLEVAQMSLQRVRGELKSS